MPSTGRPRGKWSPASNTTAPISPGRLSVSPLSCLRLPLWAPRLEGLSSISHRRMGTHPIPYRHVVCLPMRPSERRFLDSLVVRSKTVLLNLFHPGPEPSLIRGLPIAHGGPFHTRFSVVADSHISGMLTQTVVLQGWDRQSAKPRMERGKVRGSAGGSPGWSKAQGLIGVDAVGHTWQWREPLPGWPGVHGRRDHVVHQ